MRAGDPGVVESAPEELGKGTALGLAMVYGIVKQNGIHLGLERARSRRNPSNCISPWPMGERTIRPSADLTGQADGRTILIVEDDATIRTNVGRCLRHLGYRALEARQRRGCVSGVRAEPWEDRPG